MKNIIPKNVRKSKLEFWRGVGVIEIVIVLGWVSLTTLFIIGIPLPLYLKILLSVLIALIVIPLIITVMPGVKGWYALILFFSYITKKRKFDYYSSKNNTGFLVPYDCMKGDFIKTHKIKGQSKYIAGIEISGYNISLLDAETQTSKIIDLHDILKNIDFTISLLKLDLPFKFDKTINYYLSKIKIFKNLYKEKKINKKELKAREYSLYSYIEKMQKNKIDIEGDIKMKCSFFIFVYGENIKQITERIEILDAKLSRGGFKPKQMDGYNLIKTIKLIFNPFEKELNVLKYKNNKNNLENILAFKKFEINHNHFKADNLYYSINGIYDYPIYPRNGWGADLASLEQCVVWNINPIKTDDFKKYLNKAINNSRTKQVMTKSNINISENNYEIRAYENLVEEINGDNETVNNVNILFLNYGMNLKMLTQAEKRLERNLKEINIKVDKLRYRQFEAYSSFLPQKSEILINKIGREITSKSIANSFPMINGGVYDENGLYMGVNKTGDVIVLDLFLLNDKRKNHNVLITGMAGSGKTTIIMKLISYHLSMGRIVIVIDPEREYKNICNFFGGQWVDTGDAVVGRINPLQILNNNLKDNNEIDNNETHVSIHLRFLDQWFKTLYKELTERERRVLINQIQITYKKFNITNKNNIDYLENNQFPIFSDVYKTINDSLLENPGDPILKILKEIIHYDFMNDGKYEQLWNGYTSLNLKSNFIVYDVYTLFMQNNVNITAAQLYLVLNLIKRDVSFNRFNNDNEIVIIVDEAHLAIDKDNPVALNFMYQMSKRIRKYKGSLVVATQNWKDFTSSEEIRKKTEGIINNLQYTFIMNLAPSDLQDVMKVYRSYGGLSYQEQDYIARADKGEALFMLSGFDRHCLKVDFGKSEETMFKNLEFKIPKILKTNKEKIL